MNPKTQFTFFFLPFIVLTCFACPNNAKDVKNHAEIDNFSSIGIPVVLDTLKFTSGIRSIYQDSKDNYWFGSHQEGVCKYDGVNFTYFTMADGLNDNQVRSIQEDGNGHIWFGTAKGVNHFDGETINSIDLVIPSHNWDIKPTDLWVSTGNSSDVIRIDGDHIHQLKLPLSSEELPINRTTDISKGKNGSVWIAHYSGVLGFDGNEFTHTNDEAMNFYLHGGELHVRSILEDSQGRLWIGNNGIGVVLKVHDSIINFSELHNLYNIGGTFSEYPSPLGTLKHVFAITEDKNGNIWFGDRDTGAWKYDGENVSNYHVYPDMETPMIHDIYEDRNGDLLFGMANGRVYQWTGKSFKRRF